MAEGSEDVVFITITCQPKQKREVQTRKSPMIINVHLDDRYRSAGLVSLFVYIGNITILNEHQLIH